MVLTGALLDDAAFVVIDFPAGPRKVWTDENILPVYVEEGFCLDELNDAQRHIHEVALPNAIRLIDFFRRRAVRLRPLGGPAGPGRLRPARRRAGRQIGDLKSQI